MGRFQLILALFQATPNQYPRFGRENENYPYGQFSAKTSQSENTNMHEIFTFWLYFFKRTKEKNISHLHPIFYEGLLSFNLHVCMLQVHVHCSTNTKYGRRHSDSSLFISYPANRQIGLLDAEVREYVCKSTQLVTREGESISHIVLSKDKQQ